jgi:inner membrane protein
LDSVTQIVLGAACGEAVAGRKLGNRAMLWGAVGGTIPDLDVFASVFVDEINSTSFHRGFMHSFLFAALAPWVVAWLVQRFYDADVHQRRSYKTAFAVIWLLFYLMAAIGINIIPVALTTQLSWWTLLPTLVLGIWFAVKLYRDYWLRDFKAVQVSYLTWVNLFFWSIFTHPILDCFTNWGTQIWQPFSDLRVQWNTVSVVDPLYTLPFALCLIAAAYMARQNRLRMALVWLGILWGCAYLGYTYWHKQVAEADFKAVLQARQVNYQRMMSNPSIFNNIVWQMTAETTDAYIYGLYGFNDAQPGTRPLSVIPKNHALLNHIPDNDRAKSFLLWFTDGYYNVVPYRGDTLQVNDLRFGLLGDTLSGNNYVFPFLLFKNEHNQWDVVQNNRRNVDLDQNKKAFARLWARVKGNSE